MKNRVRYDVVVVAPHSIATFFLLFECFLESFLEQ